MARVRETGEGRGPARPARPEAVSAAGPGLQEGGGDAVQWLPSQRRLASCEDCAFLFGGSKFHNLFFCCSFPRATGSFFSPSEAFGTANGRLGDRIGSKIRKSKDAFSHVLGGWAMLHFASVSSIL